MGVHRRWLHGEALFYLLYYPDLSYFSLFALEKSKHLACPVNASCMHNELLHRVFKALKHNAKCKMFVSTLSISEAGSSVHLI